MTGQARIDRDLLAAALSDAIDWEASFCASHDGTFQADEHGPGNAHCGPHAYGGARPRCDAYRQALDLLTRYRAARDRVLHRPPARQEAPYRVAPWGYCPECQRRISGAALDNATKVRLRRHGRFSEDCAGTDQIVDRGQD